MVAYGFMYEKVYENTFLNRRRVYSRCSWRKSRVTIENQKGQRVRHNCKGQLKCKVCANI